MTALEISQLEVDLGLALPEEYKSLMLAHPLPDSGSYDYEFSGDFETILKENQSVRDLGFFGTPWNKSWFVIGLDGCGNEYFITTAPFDGKVYFADHEDDFHVDDLSKNHHYSTMTEYVQFLAEQEEDILKDEELLKTRIQNRKWWQSWIPRW